MAERAAKLRWRQGSAADVETCRDQAHLDLMNDAQKATKTRFMRLHGKRALDPVRRLVRGSAGGGKSTISAELLAEHGAVSDLVAIAMAEGVRRGTGSDWALSVTGIAGPGGGSAAKPVGLVHLGLAGPGGSGSAAVRFGESRGRAWIQTLSVGESLNRLRLELEAAS